MSLFETRRDRLLKLIEADTSKEGASKEALMHVPAKLFDALDVWGTSPNESVQRVAKLAKANKGVPVSLMDKAIKSMEDNLSSTNNYNAKTHALKVLNRLYSLRGLTNKEPKKGLNEARIARKQPERAARDLIRLLIDLEDAHDNRESWATFIPLADDMMGNLAVLLDAEGEDQAAEMIALAQQHLPSE